MSYWPSMGIAAGLKCRENIMARTRFHCKIERQIPEVKKIQRPHGWWRVLQPGEQMINRRCTGCGECKPITDYRMALRMAASRERRCRRCAACEAKASLKRKRKRKSRAVAPQSGRGLPPSYHAILRKRMRDELAARGLTGDTVPLSLVCEIMRQMEMEWRKDHTGKEE